MFLNRAAVTPVIMTQRMHDCLVAVQVWNKLIQRSEDQLHRDPTSLTIENTTVASALSRSLQVIVKILNDGKTFNN